MSGDELEQLLDENQRMKNQRKWLAVVLALGAGLVAWGYMRGHDAPQGDAETAKPNLAPLARRVSSAPVALSPETATPEPEEQPVATGQDESAPPPAAANDAAAVPAPVAVPPPTASPNGWGPLFGNLSIGGGNKVVRSYPAPCYGAYRCYRGYRAPYRGGWVRRAPFRPVPYRAAPFRGGFRPAPAPFRAAPFRGGGFFRALGRVAGRR